jgi:hypothetical protein
MLFLIIFQKILVWSEKEDGTYIRSPKTPKVRKNTKFGFDEKFDLR